VNPLEWFAAIYGKWFVGHPVVGYVVILLCAAIVLLPFWLLGIEKYKKENPTPIQDPFLRDEGIKSGADMKVDAEVIRGDMKNRRPYLREQLTKVIVLLR
jgi:hypothetical protein